MKIEFKCSGCKEMAYEPGALLFSPPDSNGQCSKYHICIKCFSAIYTGVSLKNFEDKTETLFDDNIEIHNIVIINEVILDRDYTSEANIERRKYTGHTGRIIKEHNSHGLCYEVQFLRGVATYDPDEFVKL